MSAGGTRWRVGLAWALLAAAPLLLPDWQVGQLAQFLCYGLLAVSLAFAWRQAGLLCFGQALFFGVGAYLCAAASQQMLPAHWPASPWAGVVLGAAGGAAAAALLGLALFVGRVVRGAFFGIVTLCACVVAERLAMNWDAIGGYNGLLDVPAAALPGGLTLLDARAGYAVLLGIAALVTAALAALAASPWGTLLRAIAADEVRTSTFGYPTARHKVIAFALSGAVAGLAGALFAGQFGFVAPTTLGFALSTEALVWVLIGGRASLTAALLGTLALKSLEAALSETLGAWWLLALGVLLMVVVTWFPQGVLGGVLAEAVPRRLRHALKPPREAAPAAAARAAAPLKQRPG